MKKWALFLLVIFSGSISEAACLHTSDNNPMPFPFKVEIIQRYEKNWIFTQKYELSLRISRTSPYQYNYFLVNHLTEVTSHGRLVRINNQLCALDSSTPFCLYNDMDTLRIEFISQNQCTNSALSILSLTR